MPFAGYDSMGACKREHTDKDDPGAYCAQIHYEVTGEWPSEEYAKQFGENATISTPIEVAEIAIKRNDIPKGTWDQIDSDSLSPFVKLAASSENAGRFKRVIDMVKLSRQDGVSDALEKADKIEKVDFNANVNRSVSMVFKQDDEFLIWGPASVEVVDKEKDKINVDALDKALPQLLKRASLSYAHTDQLVGKILDRFETDEPVEVKIGDNTYERKEFPTAVLDLDNGEPPAMYVAGEVYDDTNQSREVRQKIEDGEIDSYSISGEALVTRKQVDGSTVYDDILEMDLSAVTLCEEGMNQDAKFARVEGAEVSNVVDPTEKSASYTVEEGSVSSPEQVTAEISKSMTDSQSEEETESKGSPSEFDPDAFVKREEFEGDIATKQDVNKALEETVEKTVEAVAKELEETIPTEEDIAAKAEEAVSKSLPGGDLATVSYIEENFASKEDYEDHDDDDEGEEKGEGGEDGGSEGGESEGEDEEEENEGEKGEGGITDETRAQLKEDLPGDVWSVVSEYIGDTKEKSESEEVSKSDELEKAVAEIIEGSGISSPGVDLGERSSEPDELFKDDEQGGDEQSSPALNKWRK